MPEILRNILELSVVQHPFFTFIVMLFFRFLIRTWPAYFTAMIDIVILVIAIIVVLESPDIFRDIFLYIKGSGLSFFVADVFNESMDWGAGFVSGVFYIICLVCLVAVFVFGGFWGQNQDKN